MATDAWAAWLPACCTGYPFQELPLGWLLVVVVLSVPGSPGKVLSWLATNTVAGVPSAVLVSILGVWPTDVLACMAVASLVPRLVVGSWRTDLAAAADVLRSGDIAEAALEVLVLEPLTVPESSESSVLLPVMGRSAKPSTS